MKKTKILLTLVVVFLFPLGLMANQVKVSFSAGKAQFLKQGSSSWESIKRGVVLDLSDTIKTYKGSIVMLEGEGFKIRLSPDTELTLASLFPKAEIHIHEGKTWVQVNRLKEGQSFQMRSPSSVAGVRGTEFIYSVDSSPNKQDELLVIEGTVAFGSDFQSALELTRGKTGFLKGSRPLVQDAKDNDLRRFKSGFEQGEENPERQNQKHLERALFKNQVKQEMGRVRHARTSGQSRLKEDLSTGRTVKDKYGNTVRVEQMFRRTGKSSVELINITSTQNTINVVQYTSTFNGAVPSSLSDLVNIDKIQGKDVNKTINIVQKTGNQAPQQLKITQENGALQIAFNDNDFSPINNTVLKQREDHEYLDATYNYEEGSIISPLKLKVHLLDSGGNVVSAAAGGAGSFGLDFLSTMSFQFEFTGGGLGDDNSISFNVLPDIGFSLINGLGR